jgi:hypothetical protein
VCTFQKQACIRLGELIRLTSLANRPSDESGKETKNTGPGQDLDQRFHAAVQQFFTPSNDPGWRSVPQQNVDKL